MRIHNIDEFLHGLKVVATAYKVAHNVRCARFCIAVFVGEIIEVLQLYIRRGSGIIHLFQRTTISEVGFGERGASSEELT